MPKTYPDYMAAIETKIIDKLLAYAIEQKGYLVRVYDGEEWATKWTRDLDVIRPEVAATDETTLCFALPVTAATAAAQGAAGKRVGMIILVHGNDEDVVSDYSDNHAMNELVGHVYKDGELLPL